MQKNPILIIIGTRPEGIKMIPIYFALTRNNIPTHLCSTAQHTTLLDDVFSVFNVQPDSSLNIMQPQQDLFDITINILDKIKKLLQRIKPRLVLVQGDTTTSFAAALAAFYFKIPIAHIEAGLRTYDLQRPFPEEMNRRAISVIANLHFIPTQRAQKNLLHEGISKSIIFNSGNTIVDALRIIHKKIVNQNHLVDRQLQHIIIQCIQEKRKLILFTAHRRESFGKSMDTILSAIKRFAYDYQETITIFYPYHPNPNIITAIQHAQLHTQQNIILLKPLSYINLVYVLMKSAIIVTDSGGIQEEAISLSKPVLILRDKTERTEGIKAGLATLVGTQYDCIINNLEKTFVYATSTEIKFTSIYGDGYAAQKIVRILQEKKYA